MRGRDLAMSWLVVVALALASACGGSQDGPTGTLDRYSDALNRGDYEAAYAMMSEGFRAKHSKDEFVRMMKQNKREVSSTAARLKGQQGDLEVSAEFSYGFGDSMRLIKEDGEWRISSNPMAFYSQATPRESLRSFVRAHNLERWDVMLRFVPRKYAERMDEKKMSQQFRGANRDRIDAMMNMIQANLDEPIIEKGNEARMAYGESFEVKFVREDGKWKIQDLD
jgi:hypothetical protein